MLSDLRTELHDIDEAAQDMDARKDELADRFHRYDLVVKTGKLLMRRGISLIPDIRSRLQRNLKDIVKWYQRICHRT